MRTLWRALGKACAVLAACVALGACNEGDSKPGAAAASSPPTSTVSRSGVLFGYYASWDYTVVETQDHATLQMVTAFSSDGDGFKAIANRLTEARAANTQCVLLDLPMVYRTNGNAEVALREFFTSLNERGLIDSRICALYPADEPDLNGYSADLVRSMNTMVRRVAAEFPFIPNIPIAVIYTARGQWPGIETYDWVGFDDYDRGAAVVANATWLDMKLRLRPEQRILLVPGAFKCQSIWPFYKKAQEDSQVVAIIAFIWFDAWDTHDTSSKGLRSLPCRGEYLDAATRLKRGA